MRAAAVALVLIVGAAVVLWYGNTLNSWVLGGLIGGLAALLLSIPISLVLFSFFSRRHDDQLRAEVQEEISLAQVHEYFEAPEDLYEPDVRLLPPSEYEQSDFRTSTGRQFVSPHTLLPPARQTQQAEHQVYRQRTTEYPLQPGRPIQTASQASVSRGYVTPPRRPNPPRQVRHPGFPGYQPSSPRGLHQTAALRAARQEASQQYDGYEVYPTGASKKLPAVRPVQNLVPQQYQPRVKRSAQRLQPQMPQTPNQYRAKRTVEGTSIPPGPNRALPAPAESYQPRSTRGASYRTRDQQTDQLNSRDPQTDQLRQPTGPVTRNPQVDAQLRDPDNITGSLKRPLVRRAPYMYDDDPLRYELAQQIDVSSRQRRASRFEYQEELDD
jgi:hypothetical protein